MAELTGVENQVMGKCREVDKRSHKIVSCVVTVGTEVAAVWKCKIIHA